MRSEAERMRERNGARIHVPKRMVDYDTEVSHNFKSDGKQLSTELGAKPSNTAPSNYI